MYVFISLVRPVYMATCDTASVVSFRSQSVHVLCLRTYWQHTLLHHISEVDL